MMALAAFVAAMEIGLGVGLIAIRSSLISRSSRRAIAFTAPWLIACGGLTLAVIVFA